MENPGDGYPGYDPANDTYFKKPVYNDKLELYSIESRVFIDKFSKAVKMIATLQNITKLNLANGATKRLHLQILQFFVKEYLPEAWSNLSSI